LDQQQVTKVALILFLTFLSDGIDLCEDAADGDYQELGVANVFRSAAAAPAAIRKFGRGFDAAVLSISDENLGPFPGLLPTRVYERDTTCPMRAVVQFYCNVDTLLKENGEIHDETKLALDWVISKVTTPFIQAADADKGSLVTDVHQGRITEPGNQANHPQANPSLVPPVNSAASPAGTMMEGVL
jgi:hypothetical protein